eukprot:5994805-Alexandrium_andersonii.AAC.1
MPFGSFLVSGPGRWSSNCDVSLGRRPRPAPRVVAGRRAHRRKFVRIVFCEPRSTLSRLFGRTHSVTDVTKHEDFTDASTVRGTLQRIRGPGDVFFYSPL